MDNIEKATLTLRLGLGFTILWFGVMQLLSPQDWIGYLPSLAFTTSFISTTVLIYINGIFETFTALLILSNQFTKIISILLAIHMFFIIFHLGYNDLAIRDFAIFSGFIALSFLSTNSNILKRKFTQQ